MRTLLLVMALLLAACGGDPAPEDGRLRVAVSVPPQGWLVERIGGDAVAVQVLVPPGASPHSHQLSDRDLAELMRCRVYFRTGVPFERGAWFDAVDGDRGPRVIDLRHGLIEIDDGEHEHDHDHDHHHDHGVDPHIWLDPRMLMAQAAGIRDVLAAVEPTAADGFRSRAATVIAELEGLDAELGAQLAPFRDRAFAVYHPAWTRFAAAYDLRQLAIERANGSPSDAELTTLQRSLREEGITTLFVQPQIHGAAAASLAEILGLRVRSLDPLAADPVTNLRTVVAELVASWAK